MRNHKKVILSLSSLLLLSFLASACDSGGGKSCGPGTMDQNGTCVPEIELCGAGTIIQDGVCVPVCPTAEYWDGSQCATVPECAAGTVFDTASGTCQPACPQGETWDGQACVTAPTCAAGTVYDPDSGQCVLSDDVCGQGTILVNGQCEADLQCGPGTYQENGQCLPTSLPDPDVLESSDPDQAALFNLPDAGSQIYLGGTVDTPVDINGDGYTDTDWDSFAFHAAGGTYLRIQATSAQAALPAFALFSASVDGDGYALYSRFAIEPNALNLSREIYLPFDDDYVLMVSDYNNMMIDMFGAGFLPVGGDDFSYLVTVENLGLPIVQTADSLPLLVENDLNQGQIYFWEVPGLLQRDLLQVTASGRPPEGLVSDLMCAVMVFAPDGSLLVDSWESRHEPTRVNLAVQTGGNYLVVQDHAVAMGFERGASLEIDLPPQEDCVQNACSGGSLAEGESRLLRYDLLADDFFLFNGTVPAEATENLRVAFFDQHFEVISEASAGTTWNRWDHLMAEQDTWVYLLVEGWSGGEVPDYTLDLIHQSLPEMIPGQGLGGVNVIDMPDETIEDCGLSWFPADADQLAVSLLSETNNRAWTNPLQEFYTTDLAYLGPALDPATAAPVPLIPVAYLREAGTYLHMVSDPGSDIVGGTYDADVALLSVSTMGQPITGNPVSAVGQSLHAGSGVAAYTINALADSSYTVTVTPEGGSTAELEVSVLNFGWHYNTTWYDSATSAELGMLSQGLSNPAGSPVMLTAISPYEGDLVILVRDTSGSSSGDTFAIEVQLND